MYRSVPFDVPRGTNSIEVRIDYDAGTGARIDIGCEGENGWRGWSGGARRRFVIGREQATWGYVPGEIEPGIWNVVLGLHVVPVDGVDLTIDILVPGGNVLTDPESEPPVERVAWGRPGLPAPEGLTWFACDFHAHSLHSDGSQSLDQLARRAAYNGLDVLAIVDHNTISHHSQLPAVGARQAITLLPGQEITTARGHANAFGEIGWVDFRRHPRHWARQVTAEGGILSVNHPVSGDCSWQWPLEHAPTHAEIMHSSWFAARNDTSIWSWWNAWGSVVPIGGSDFHYPESGVQPGTPTTWVAAAEPTVPAILEALRAGRTAVSVGTRAATMVRLGDELVLHDADGLVLHDQEGRRRVVRGDRAVLPAHPERRYHLESADRRIMALVGSVLAD